MSILAFPQYLVGTHVSGCIVTGCTVSNAGVVTPATGSGNTGNLATSGTVDEVTFEKMRTTAQIQPINSVLDNFVPLASGFTCEVGEIRLGDGTSLLDAIAANFTYAEVILNITPPGGTASWTDAVIGVIERVQKGYVAEKNGIIMSLKPIGIATYTGAYSATPYA